ncbi:MAG: O-antigen ligase family protein, partial [Planctomycetes bacterium]|nr:O-antigen ligase family protein [Planctomycetota bacterium]
MFSRAFDILCLIVLLAIVGLRPLVGESFRVASASSSMAVEGLRDPLTWHTLLINIVIFALALVVTLRRAFSKRTTFRPSGTEVGAFILMVASVVACLAASEKRSAMLAALDLMGAFALLCSLVQLFDQRWKWLLGLMVIVASGLANVAASIDQSTYWMAENEQQYEQTRESMWANKGVPLDSAQVELFENRMRSGEASGYFSHSNVAGGYLLLVLFALIGCVLMARSAGSKSGGHGLTIVFSVLTLLTAWALYLTHGNGPMMAGIVMLTLLAVAFVRKTWWENHRPQVFRAAVILVVAAIIGVPVFGLMAGGLPGASLDFRWQYWQASSDMFADHWQTGVGPENFGDAYLQYKTIANSEEVKNPHNGLVQFATEYGSLGLVGCVLVLLGGAKMYHRSTLNPLPVEKRTDPPRTKPTDVQRYFAGAASVTALVFLFHPAMLPSQDPAFVKLHRIMVVPIWIVVLIAGGFLARSADTFVRSRNRWMPALGFGLAAFLLQDSINFAFFVPGARTTFAAMFALTLCWIDRPGESVEAIAQPRSRWIPPVVSAIALVFASWAMVAVMPAEEALAEAYQQSEPTRFSLPAQDKYLEARRLDTLSPTASAEHAR